MRLKEFGFDSTTKNIYDLLGYKEVGLTKALAYLFSKEPVVLYDFLRFIGMKIKNTKNNYKNTSIIIERKREKNRTDIEIYQKGKFHIIIEAKVRQGKIKEQRTRYLSLFKDVPIKILCIIGGVNDYKKEILDNNIIMKNLGWIDVFNNLDNTKNNEIDLVSEYLIYMRRGFKMSEQKEILVQDLGDSAEVDRFRNYQVYRRNVVYGSPLYFAPYFTAKAKQQEGIGISFLSKVLGILSLKPSQVESFRDDLNVFNNNDKVLTNMWVEGVKIDTILKSKENEEFFTYFFLDETLKLDIPLLKDDSNRKGWIRRMISPNQCVTFLEFTKRMNTTKKKD